ncbi:MAG TPA: FAD:protein FMN transferase [Candidatus Kapabacteria bacterium]|jgi:thiamine biosynthesis lipoprotein|nr:FAD:protein FMN transferase [Candidatus Kapabacteria bacterium]
MEEWTRRLFLKRASQACGVLVFLPAAKSIGKIGLANKEGYYEHTILAMGTTARLGVYAKNEAQANEVITAAFSELKRIESLLTIFDTKSEISQLNEHTGSNAIAVSSDTLAILRTSAHYSQLTQGAFDITIEPLMRLWGFRNVSNVLSRLPLQGEVNSALNVVGYNQVEISEQNLVRLKSAGAKLDLGGIAVGFALDKMTSVLRNAGIENAFLDISGDMFALGTPPRKKGWDIAIPDPHETSRLIYTTTISDEALATSGNYMSYVIYQAQKFGHIMDPHEGRSAHRLLSSTVIAKTGLDADALSTASFVTGKRYGESKLVRVDLQGLVQTL